VIGGVGVIFSSSSNTPEKKNEKEARKKRGDLVTHRFGPSTALDWLKTTNPLISFKSMTVP
jgi:hypothetical protein